MDSKRFDALSRSLAASGTRRGMLRWLTTLPVAGVFLTTLAGASAAGRHGKRQRHHTDHQRHRDRPSHDAHEQGKSRHSHSHAKGSRRDKQQAAGQIKGPGEKCSKSGQCVSQQCNRKKGGRGGRCLPSDVNQRCRLDTDCTAGLSCQKEAGSSPDTFGLCQAGQTCTPESMAQTCAGRCGAVSNNCGAQVDCGSCACGSACLICQTCDPTTGRCQTNPDFIGQACGLPGQVCQADGTCVCDGASCADGQRCNGLVCICDATSCTTGCCDGNRTCRIDDDAACGTNGGTCTRCTGAGVTCGGGTSGQCGCISQGCGTQTCGSTVDNCGQAITCGGCTGCCDGNTCRGGTNPEACGTSGESCHPCSGGCSASGVCTACDLSLAPCADGQCCVGGACVASCPDCQTCIGGTCASDVTQNRTTCQLPDGDGTGVCCRGTCCAGCCDAGDENGVCSPCMAFVTSTTYTGNLGGLAGADDKCQERAEAGGLWGTYKVWLSVTFGSPASRFRCTAASCSSQGYQGVDGTTIASDWADLTTCGLDSGVCLDAAIRLDEQRQLATTNPAWTNTRINGTSAGEITSCQNWSNGTSGVVRGDTGQPGEVDSTWTFASLNGCTNARSLYCFQQS